MGKIDPLALLPLVFNFVIFESKRNDAISLSISMLTNLFNLCKACSDNYSYDLDILFFIANKLIFFVNQLDNSTDSSQAMRGSLLFRFKNSLIIVDPANDFSITLPIKYPSQVCLAIQKVTSRESKIPTLKECSKRIEIYIANLLEYKVKKLPRRNYILAPESMCIVLNNSDKKIKSKAAEYILAISQNRLHDAMQIQRGEKSTPSRL